MADKTGLLEKLEKYGIDKVLKLLSAPGGMGSSVGGALGATLGGPAGGMIGGAAGTGLDALRSLFTPQQPMMGGEVPNLLDQGPMLGGQMQQGPMNNFLMGGAQGLGNFTGQQLGQGGMGALSLLGQGASSAFKGDFLKKLLEMIPEKDIQEYLASLQANRG